MQSLLSTVITKLSGKQIEEIQGVHLPRTLVDACRAARKSRFDMQELYEVHLGPIHPGYIGYCRSGHVDILKTLEKLSRFDKTPAFKYYCALNDKEKLKEIWETISEEDRKGLLADKEWVIAYRAKELQTESDYPAESTIHTYYFLTECLARRWEKPFFDVYPKLEMNWKVIVLSATWTAALLKRRIPNSGAIVQFLLQTMRTILAEHNLEFNEESCAAVKENVRPYHDRLFNVWIQKHPENSLVPAFDRIMRELTKEKSVFNFRAQHEAFLGVIPLERFKFNKFGEVDEQRTAENLVELDPALAFGYCARFNRFEAMLRIWDRLSEAEKSRLKVHRLTGVSIRAFELGWNDWAERKRKLTISDEDQPDVKHVKLS